MTGHVHMHVYIRHTCTCVPTGNTCLAMLIAGLRDTELQLSHLCWATGFGHSQNHELCEHLGSTVNAVTTTCLLAYVEFQQHYTYRFVASANIYFFFFFLNKKMHMPVEKHTLESVKHVATVHSSK